jgi:hypothetical protein
MASTAALPRWQGRAKLDTELDCSRIRVDRAAAAALFGRDCDRSEAAGRAGLGIGALPGPLRRALTLPSAGALRLSIPPARKPGDDASTVNASAVTASHYYDS